VSRDFPQRRKTREITRSIEKLAPRLSSAATQRNRDPILAVLRRALPPRGAVLEVASGAGEHAVWFARHLPELVFQPSDPDAEGRASITAWIAHQGLANVRAPLALEAAADRWQLPQDIARELVAVVCINMIHISPWEATRGLLRNAAAVLPAGALLYLYGPYRRGGAHTAPSNAAFDASLRERDPAWGVRDLEAVVAAAAGFALEEVVEMPANNLSLLLRRRDG
jgi:hypothetical protein